MIHEHKASLRVERLIKCYCDMKSSHLLQLILSVISFMPLQAQWIQVPNAPNGYINDIVVVGDTFYLARPSAGVYRSTDNAQSWELLDQGLNNMQAKGVNQLLVMGDTIFAATDDGIYRSTDTGINWDKKSNGIQVGGGALYAFAMSIYNHNGRLITGAYTGIYYSVDWGETWQLSNISGDHVYPQNIIDHSGILFAARESINTPYGFQSTDGGLTWSDMTIGQPTICFFSEPGKLWCGTIDGVWLSQDDGATWEERNNGLSLDPYSADIIRVGNQLITSLKFGGSGVYHSYDDGLNWEDFSEGLGFFTIISKFIYKDGILYVITSDGLWQREMNVTAVPEKGFPQNKIDIRNYPNPFTDQTRIDFTIDEAGPVRLEVLNNRGEIIYTMLDQFIAAGKHNIMWTGNSEKGILVPPGVYFYRLALGGEMVMGKMVKIK